MQSNLYDYIKLPPRLVSFHSTILWFLRSKVCVLDFLL